MSAPGATASSSSLPDGSNPHGPHDSALGEGHGKGKGRLYPDDSPGKGNSKLYPEAEAADASARKHDTEEGGPSAAANPGAGAARGGLLTRLFGPPAKDGPGGLFSRASIFKLLGEFCGTFLFLFLAFFAAQSALSTMGTAPLEPQTILFIAFSFGLALLLSLWVFAGISGEMFNPAVTLGLALIRAITPVQALLNIIVQMLAGIAAAGLVHAITPGPLLVANGLSPAVSPARGIFVEALLTAQLVLTVFLLKPQPLSPSRSRRSASTGAAYVMPIAIATSVFLGHLTGIPFTGTGINPARSFGPGVVNAHFDSAAWIYYVGPFLGSFIATAVYTVVRFLVTSACPDYQARPDPAADVETAKGAGHGRERI